MSYVWKSFSGMFQLKIAPKSFNLFWFVYLFIFFWQLFIDKIKHTHETEIGFFDKVLNSCSNSFFNDPTFFNWNCFDRIDFVFNSESLIAVWFLAKTKSLSSRIINIKSYHVKWFRKILESFWSILRQIVSLKQPLFVISRGSLSTVETFW